MLLLLQVNTSIDYHLQSLLYTTTIKHCCTLSHIKLLLYTATTITGTTTTTNTTTGKQCYILSHVINVIYYYK